MKSFLYTVEKTFPHSLGLSACFRQHKARGSHCRFLHGYALEVSLVVGSNALNEKNWCYDFGSFKDIKRFLETTFDHKLVVAFDDPEKVLLLSLADAGVADVLVLANVGCEAFARYILESCIQNILSHSQTQDVYLLSVTVREHSGNSATYHNPNL